jgi:hypothetical protein
MGANMDMSSQANFLATGNDNSKIINSGMVVDNHVLSEEQAAIALDLDVYAKAFEPSLGQFFVCIKPLTKMHTSIPCNDA